MHAAVTTSMGAAPQSDRDIPARRNTPGHAPEIRRARRPRHERHPDKTAHPDAPSSAPGAGGALQAASHLPHRKGDSRTMIDAHPFQSLLPSHATVLFRFALKLAADEHRAEDLVQETFLKAWAHRDGFTHGTELRGWLFTILRNTFYSDLRKRRREVQDVAGKLAGLLFEEAPQDHAVDLQKLLSALAQLPEIHRRPVLLMGAYGYSQQEAAEACNCTIGTIKSRVSRGRSHLGRALGRDAGEPRPARPLHREGPVQECPSALC